MNVANALKPTMIFAAGTFATSAHATTVIDTTTYHAFPGSSITLAGAATPQYSFAKDQSDNYVLAGSNGALVTTTGQSSAFFPDSNSNLASSVVTGNFSAKGPSSPDLYYGLKFEAGNVGYTGYAVVSQPGGETISEIAYKPSAVAAVPEPETWALMIAGFGGVGLAMRRRRRQAPLRAVA